MSKRSKDVPGNSVLSAVVLQEAMARVGMVAYRLEHHMRQLVEEGITITALRFTYKAGVDGDVLCVVSAVTDSGKIVAFHSDDCFVDTMKGTINRIANRSLKWRDDAYE